MRVCACVPLMCCVVLWCGVGWCGVVVVHVPIPASPPRLRAPRNLCCPLFSALHLSARSSLPSTLPPRLPQLLAKHAPPVRTFMWANAALWAVYLAVSPSGASLLPGVLA